MIHPHGYWIEISSDNTHVFDKSLSDAIIETFEIKSAVDLGCGDGRYVANFIDNGIDCIGYDGHPGTAELTKGLGRVLDLSQFIDVGKFDFVLSLEVGEHIPAEFEQTFLDNLCKSSSKWVCLSWGVPGQPGYGHVNCKDNNYIICEMARRGFRYLPGASKILRKKSTFDWFKNTILTFTYGLEE